MGKVFPFAIFLVLSPLVIIISLVLFTFVSYQKNPLAPSFFLFLPPRTVSFAALPTNQNIFAPSIDQGDARVEVVRQFFARYHSPLEPFANTVVKAADAHDLDFRLIPAIAMQESNLCAKAPKGSNNCWGFGIYGGKVKQFTSLAEGIEVVTKALAKEYKGKGLTTPTEIMAVYTPSSNGSWAQSVNHFMDQLTLTSN